VVGLDPATCGYVVGYILSTIDSESVTVSRIKHLAAADLWTKLWYSCGVNRPRVHALRRESPL
jgi:hypothetical protein